jgi:hypothetical protein
MERAQQLAVTVREVAAQALANKAIHATCEDARA